MPKSSKKKGSKQPGAQGQSQGASPDPIFLTGRFRSGTTVLWHLLRGLPDVRAYFEPLHDNLLDYLDAGLPTDPTHRGVDEYFAEYRTCLDAVRTAHRPALGVSELCLGGSESCPELETYLRVLIDATGAGRSLFKLVRADFRLPWLRARFPRARLISIRRDPRESWASMVRGVDDEALRNPWLNTGYDLLIWAANLYPHLPAIAETCFETSYEPSYMLWRVSGAVADRYADLVVDFDRELQQQPEQTLERVLDCARLDGTSAGALAKGVVSIPPAAAARFGERVPFAEIEAHCEGVLEQSGLLDEIASGRLDDHRWRTHSRGGGAVWRRMTSALALEISGHRRTLLRNQSAYQSLGRGQREQLDALRAALDAKDVTANALQSELDKVLRDSAAEIRERDAELERRDAVAAALREEIARVTESAAKQTEASREALDTAAAFSESLRSELEKVRRDAERELRSRDEQIVKGQDYASSLGAELEKVRAENVRELEARAEQLASAERYAASLVAELEKIKRDAASEIAARDAELDKRQRVGEALSAALEEERAAAGAALEARGQVDGLQAELTRVREDAAREIATRDRELAERERVAVELLSDVALRDADLEKHHRKLRSLHETTDQLHIQARQELAARDEQLAERDEVIIGLRHEIDKVRADSQEEIEARDERIADRDEVVADLHRELERVRGDSATEIEARDRELEHRDEFVTSLRAEIEKVQRDARAEIVARDEWVASLQGEIAGHEETHASLREALAAREAELAERGGFIRKLVRAGRRRASDD